MDNCSTKAINLSKSIYNIVWLREALLRVNIKALNMILQHRQLQTCKFKNLSINRQLMTDNVMLTLWLLHQLTPPVWETRLFLFHDDYQPTDPPLCLQSQAYHPARGWLEALLERNGMNNITLKTPFLKVQLKRFSCFS